MGSNDLYENVNKKRTQQSATGKNWNKTFMAPKRIKNKKNVMIKISLVFSVLLTVFSVWHRHNKHNNWIYTKAQATEHSQLTDRTAQFHVWYIWMCRIHDHECNVEPYIYIQRPEMNETTVHSIPLPKRSATPRHCLKSIMLGFCLFSENKTEFMSDWKRTKEVVEEEEEENKTHQRFICALCHRHRHTSMSIVYVSFIVVVVVVAWFIVIFPIK